MDTSEAHIIIIFDEPFYIALFERIVDGQYSVAKEIIGTSDPTNADLLMFFERLQYEKLRFSTPVEGDVEKTQRKVSFKRLQKLAKKETEKRTLHTYSKAHEQLKLLQEELKLERKKESKAEKEAKEERKFALRLEKKKAKHRGR